MKWAKFVRFFPGATDRFIYVLYTFSEKISHSSIENKQSSTFYDYIFVFRTWVYAFLCGRKFTTGVRIQPYAGLDCLRGLHLVASRQIVIILVWIKTVR